MHNRMPHILVVDDSLAVRMDLRAALTKAGFSVTLCETRRAAEMELRTGMFGLVILDMLLPDGNGIDLLRQLRTDPTWLTTPVVVLSTEAEVRHRLQGLKTGAVEYIGKPYNAAYLVQRVVRWTRSENAASDWTEQRGVGGKKILAVDDDGMFLRIIAAQLRHDRHEVVAARSGEQALEILAVEPVDCIVMDLILPGIDGVETSRRIKAIPNRRDIPIVILTGADTRDARKRGLDVEIDDFVAKSPRLDIIRVHVRTALRRQRIRRARGDDLASSDASGAPRSLSFVESLIAVSGLPEHVARHTIEVACGCRGGDALSPALFLQMLACVREALRAYLSTDDVTMRIAGMAAIARLSEARALIPNPRADTNSRPGRR
jgi:DNA-binding response OmpR family regulator